MNNTTFFIRLVVLGGCLLITNTTLNAQSIMNQISPKVNVWDTYVTKKDGGIMHFDIIAPVSIQDTSQIYQYGKAYLRSKGQEGQPLSAAQCRLCHIEQLRPEWATAIEQNGYFIIEMEGCR
ncbi:MAG: DUF2024 family protein [Bacteroidota bacterium]